MGSVAYGDTFLLVGGFTRPDSGDAGWLDTVYEYVAEEERFRLVPGAKLSEARSSIVAMAIDAQAFPPCE